MPKSSSSPVEGSDRETIDERVHHMVCMHGSTGYLEEPDSVTVAREHTGLRIEGRDCARAVISVPIPTTFVFKGSRMAIRSVLLDFAASPGVSLDSVRIFSGSRLISSHDELGYSGRSRYRKFEVEGHPKLNMPLSLSIAVAFGSGQGYFNLVSTSAVFIEKVTMEIIDTP